MEAYAQLTEMAPRVSRWPKAQERLHLLLTSKQWGTAIVTGLAGGVIALPFSLSISPWIAVSVFLFGLTACHMRYAVRFIIPLPHIAILITILEYVLAAWASVFFSPDNPLYDIGAEMGSYLSFAGPMIVAVCLGWSFGMLGLSNKRKSNRIEVNSGVLAELDVLLVVGLAGIFARPLLTGTSVAFVGVLLGYLRFVSIHARMILKGRGWHWRVALVLGTELVLAADSAMFNPLLLWSIWTFAIWLYCSKPPFRTIAVVLIISAFLLPALQESKWRLRGDLEVDEADSTDYSREASDSTAYSKTTDWLQYMGEGLERSITFALPRDFIADTVTRYNQGWIVNRTMFVVPQYEPYARGETLVEASRAALLPRFVDSQKVEVGGQIQMARFAGIWLNENTSMTLGYVGEMYANFGRRGGIVACGIYAFVFAIAFRLFAVRAILRPIWWSFVPYVFFAALKGDDSIAFIANWTTKSFVVIAAIILLLPHLRSALFERAIDASRRVQ